MASADLYGALVAFLDGDAGDVRTRLNVLEPGLLAAGAVTVSRASRGKSPRSAPRAGLVAIDIVPADGAGATRGAGIGLQEVPFDVRFEITLRSKDLPVGKAQLRTLESIQQDLVALYEGMSALAIADPSAVATFKVASARRGPVDRTPAASGLQTAVVNATFAFYVPMTSNA